MNTVMLLSYLFLPRNLNFSLWRTCKRGTKGNHINIYFHVFICCLCAWSRHASPVKMCSYICVLSLKPHTVTRARTRKSHGFPHPCAVRPQLEHQMSDFVRIRSDCHPLVARLGGGFVVALTSVPATMKMTTCI